MGDAISKFNNMRYTDYTEKDEKLVESGIEAIKEVLLGDNIEKKQSVLFCLDKYLDPWYGYHLSYENEIFTLLEQMVVSEKDIDTVSDVLELLAYYSSGPYPLHKENLEQFDKELKSQVKDLIQQETVWKLEEIMNEECKRIYEESYSISLGINMEGIFPQKAIIVSDRNITSKSPLPQKDCDALFSMENGIIKPIGIPSQGISIEGGAIPSAYYHQAKFFYGINVDMMKITLIYFFAGRWSRCQEYSVSLQENKYVLGKPECMWVG